MHENVVSGLVRRRRELALEADIVRGQYEALLADVAALDRSILLFDPDTDIAAIAPLAFTRKEDWAKRGAIARAILSALRGVSEPLSAAEIVARLSEDRSLPIASLTPKLASRRVNRSLARLRDNGAVESRASAGGQYLEWRTA
jgi:DNA-binding transcriptional ArsR family regulator